MKKEKLKRKKEGKLGSRSIFKKDNVVEYVACAKKIIFDLIESCRIIASRNDLLKSEMEAQEVALEIHKRELDKKFLLPWKRKKILNDVMKISARIAEIDKEQKKTLMDKFKEIASAGIYIVSSCVSAFLVGKCIIKK